MNRVISALLFSLLLSPLALQAAGFDFSGYAALLDRYVVADQSVDSIPLNAVDYERWAREQALPGSAYRKLLGNLAGFDPASLEGKDERLAFWINVYNIAAIKTLLDHYPVESIRSRRINWLGQPWTRETIRVGGQPFSLNEIEFDILIEGLRDLRAHLAINCASVSCADLRPEPYRAEALGLQLREQGERLAAQPEKGLRIDRAARRVSVSQIFKFDRKHFDAWTGGPVAFLIPYVTDPVDRAFLEAGDYTLEYLDYDWSANDLKWVDQR
ncbi:MAG: DUF547 domain-containing protein [Desulfuromonas sp.]|uniref:DUF547 domain-containing protein n=1 Tax=Desulfuromonas sp. TaxID=892 RepID=UPI000CB894D0|nr:DUF547 domain-containing protein [Desulfuromonas sp.]PLX84291.1 MAG: DUF547 domain-containing protein [Desulfuromonas sp.]